MSKIKYNPRKLLLSFFTILIAIVFLFVANRLATGGNAVFGKSSVASVYPAKIELVLAKNYTDNSSPTELQIRFEAEILSGDKKGQSIFGRQFISVLNPVQQKQVEQGDLVLIRNTPFGEENIWVFQEYNRSGKMLVFGLVFVAILLFLGRKKGLATVVSLSLTFSCLFLFFLPAILCGVNIYLASIISCIFITLVTLILVHGVSQKSVSAAVGCFGGLVVAGLGFTIMEKLLNLTGVISEESTYLMIMDSTINLKAIMFSSILIGVLGGVLDVSVSIVSSLSEVFPDDSDDKPTMSKIFASGMNIGKDIISTMTNTLILVYIGSALPSTMLLIVYSNSFLELINREAIIFEMLQAIIGSMGIILTIPLTTLFYAFVRTRTVKIHHNKPKKLKPALKDLGEPVPLKINRRNNKAK